VRQPTLLIVGENDRQVIELNRKAMTQLSAPTQLEIVPRATHLFEEPGALQQVARLAKDWFIRHLGPPANPRHRVVTGQLWEPLLHVYRTRNGLTHLDHRRDCSAPAPPRLNHHATRAARDTGAMSVAITDARPRRIDIDGP
jgi:hypothetical protein